MQLLPEAICSIKLLPAAFCLLPFHRRTWGNHAFGYAWDRLLTEPDKHGVYRPYIELMSGAFTENQPDFSWLQPGETKTFSQYWFPFRAIGPANKANTAGALHLSLTSPSQGENATVARVGVAVTSEVRDAMLVLSQGGKELHSWPCPLLRPDAPFTADVTLPPSVSVSDGFTLRLVSESGADIIRYDRASAAAAAEAAQRAPEPATEPPLPSEIASNDELYITGLHLDQYRHATRFPQWYWEEALRRDPMDSRCNSAMGLLHLRRGEFTQAEAFFRAAIKRLTRRNPNPYDSEAYYNLALALRHQSGGAVGCVTDGAKEEEAYGAAYKATWVAAWRGPAYHLLAEMDCGKRDWATALAHVEVSLHHGADNLRARNLKALVLRKLGREAEAAALLEETLALDRLDHWAAHIAGAAPLSCDNQVRLDIAIDYASAGFVEEALSVLAGPPDVSSAASSSGNGGADVGARDGSVPMIYYYIAHYQRSLRREKEAATAAVAAKDASTDYCFPARLSDIAILTCASAADPSDARAPYYLGNLLYDRRRYEEAIGQWERAAHLDPSFSIVWRNLGIAYFNKRSDAPGALEAYERAYSSAPDNARVLFERDQLWKRVGRPPAQRLQELRARPHAVASRDDLTVEYCGLLAQTGAYTEALKLLLGRKFQPWEGGEGQALGLYVRCRLALGREALAQGQPSAAVEEFRAALHAPLSLGEAKHLLVNQSDIHYWLGVAHDAAGDVAAARAAWAAAASFRGDFQGMSVRAYSEMTYYSARSLERLGRREEATELFKRVQAYARGLLASVAKIDYFATSLPTMLLFEDDLQARQGIHADLMLAQAALGLGDEAECRRLLTDILRREPSHAAAADMLKEVP